MKYIAGKAKWRQGQVLVEAALVLPILLMLLFGIIEFGRIFNTYLIVSNASREGARLAALSAVESIDIEDEIKDFIVDTGLCETGEVDDKVDITSILIKNEDLNSDGVDDEVSYSKTDRKSGDRILVEVRYDMELITPIVGPIIDEEEAIDIEAYTQMRVE